jgi:hypothetical protein
MAEAVAPASFTASATLAKTGRPRCVCPAFLGFVPPTTVVPIFLSDMFQLNPGSATRTVLDSLLRMESAEFTLD